MNCNPFTCLLAGLSVLSFTPSAIAQTANTAAAAAPAKTASEIEHEKLFAVFAAADEADMARDPISAIYRGDLRKADTFGDYLKPAFEKQGLTLLKGNLRALKKVKRDKLSQTDQIAYDVFKQTNEADLTSYAKAISRIEDVLPMNHFTGFHTFYPSFSSGDSGAPFRTLADYENNLKRHAGYAAYLDLVIGRFRKGLSLGITDTRMTVNNIIGQLDNLINQATEESVMYGPVKTFPESISTADQARLKSDYARIIADVVTPAHVRLRDFLKTEYLPKARDGVGLAHIKGGDKLYAHNIAMMTTLPLSAEDVHTLGLAEVARIRGEMDMIRQKVGFPGTLANFFIYLRTDPNFKAASKDALVQGYYAIGKTVDARIGTLFSTIPKTPLEIRYYEPWREKNEAGGSYDQGLYDPKDQSKTRPGVFYFNTYDLPSRTTPGMETLYLHEGAPGHHFQISLAQENEALPAFMRYGGNTAYVEGWALYAETLYDELGMETDPYSRFGGLDDEMLRAMRLVVDSGIHAKRWTREQAIKYMLDNSSMGDTDATSEVERYIAWPGQALAYKVGQLTFLRLRNKAEKALGTKFDLKEFHAQVLMTGALPMTVMEKKIDNWIALKLKG